MSARGASTAEGGTRDEAGATSQTASVTVTEAGAKLAMATAPGQGTGAVGTRKHARRPAGAVWWPRRRSMVLDVLLALVAATECAFEGIAAAYETTVPVLVVVAIGLVAGTALLFRRRWPVAAVVVTLAMLPVQAGIVLSTVSLYTLAASPTSRRITYALAGMTMVGIFARTLVELRGSGDFGGDATAGMAVAVISLMGTIGVTVAPLLLGLYVGARRRLVESLVDRANGLERELALLAEKATERAQRARIEERTRIAREMHDVVAHRVSLMVVHAGALRVLAGSDPEKARQSAELLGDMGRQALDELRQMLGVLRASEAANPACPPVLKGVSGGTQGAGVTGVGRVTVPAQTVVKRTGTGAVPDGARGGGTTGAPSPDGDITGPGLGDVTGLVEQSREAGIAVKLSVEGEPRPLAEEVDRTAYRMVQEALTNVHKHAPGASVRVRVAYRPDEVAVLVENGPPDGRPSAALPSGGNGLLGMRERVTALGGGFAAGAREDGGFRVSAMLPDRSGGR